ncbi:hypothetical protein KIPB_011956, partial [Kipferlia bialata]|eukprot:g11956.t1
MPGCGGHPPGGPAPAGPYVDFRCLKVKHTTPDTVCTNGFLLVRSVDSDRTLPLGTAQHYKELLEVVYPSVHGPVLSIQGIRDLRQRLREGEEARRQLNNRSGAGVVQECGASCAAKDDTIRRLQKELDELRQSGTRHGMRSQPLRVPGTLVHTHTGQRVGAAPSGVQESRETARVRVNMAQRRKEANVTFSAAPTFGKDKDSKRLLDATIDELERVSLEVVRQGAELAGYKERVAELEERISAVRRDSGTSSAQSPSFSPLGVPPSPRHSAPRGRSMSTHRGSRVSPSPSRSHLDAPQGMGVRAEVAELRSQIDSLMGERASLEHKLSEVAVRHQALQAKAVLVEQLQQQLDQVTREKQLLESKGGAKKRELLELNQLRDQWEKRARHAQSLLEREKRDREQTEAELNQQLSQGASHVAHLEQKVKKTSDGVYSIEGANPTSLEAAYGTLLSSSLSSIKTSIRKVKRKTPEWEELEGEWLDLVGEWEG